MNIFDKVGEIFLNPKKFFTKLKKEKGIYQAFKYLAVLALISTILNIVKTSAFRPLEINFIQNVLNIDLPTHQTIQFDVLSSLLGYVGTVLLFFVIAAILHLWIKMFRGKASYKKTYQLYVYGSTPGFLFSWIPFIGGMSWIYDLVLLIIGTTIIHKVSKTRSIVIYLVPVALMLILITVLVLAFIALFTVTQIPDVLNNLGITLN